MPRLFTALRSRLTRYFLAGLFAILPVAITIAIIVWLAEFLNRFLGPGTDIGQTLRRLGYRFAPDDNLAYVLGCVLVLIAIFVLGVLLENGARRWAMGLVRNTIERVPVLRTIYQAAVQVLSMFRAGEDERLRGMAVVMCRFGENGGTWALGLAPSSETVSLDGRAHRAVLLPTAPVPFGGALLFLPADAVTPAGISLDEFISVYMSMGVTMPAELVASDMGAMSRR